MAFHVNTAEVVKRKKTTFQISSRTLKAVMQGQVRDLEVFPSLFIKFFEINFAEKKFKRLFSLFYKNFFY